MTTPSDEQIKARLARSVANQKRLREALGAGVEPVPLEDEELDSGLPEILQQVVDISG